MLPFKRSQRVSHLIRKEVSDIIFNRVKDPRLGFLTVTGVEVTDDLKTAHIYVSTLKDEEEDETLEALSSAKKFIRSELSKRLRMRAVPAIVFRNDRSSRYGSKIERLLREAREEH